jgi:hypothetical protein
MAKKLIGKKFKVKLPDGMLAKLNEGLNRNKEVIIRSDDDGYTIVFGDGFVNEINCES